MVALLLSTGGCGSVQIEDKTVYGSLGDQGAAEFHTETEEFKHLTYSEWNEKWLNLEDPMSCMSYTDFGKMKKEIETLCSVSGKCTYEFKKAVKIFFRKIDNLKSKTESLP